MDIKEIKVEQILLKDNIAKLMKEFAKKTGLKFGSDSFIQTDDSNSKETKYNVFLGITNPF